jgi:hypothetical protein
MTPVGVPPAGADLASEWLDEIGLRPADGHELAPAATAQCLADAFANDVARANQAPSHSHRVQGSGFRVQGSFGILSSGFRVRVQSTAEA